MALVRSWLASMSAFLLLNFILSLVLPRDLEFVYIVCPLVAGIIASMTHLYSTKQFKLNMQVSAVLGGVFLMATYYNFIVLFNLHRPFLLALWGVGMNMIAALIGVAVVFGAWKLIFEANER